MERTGETVAELSSCARGEALQVIERVKEKSKEIEGGLPAESR